jgi:hypothetical protein
VQNDDYTKISSLQSNQILYARVRPNPTATWSAEAQYRLHFGSAPATDSHIVSGESGFLKIPSSVSGITLSTQALQKITWTARFYDSKGAPLHGVESFMVFNKGGGSINQTKESITNTLGLGLTQTNKL